MTAVYPGTSFLPITRDAFVRRENHAVVVTSPWRRKLINKEIQGWATSLAHAKEIASAKSKGFPLCMVLMPSLLSMHHFAIAHGYSMTFCIETDRTEIRYEFNRELRE